MDGDSQTDEVEERNHKKMEDDAQNEKQNDRTHEYGGNPEQMSRIDFCGNYNTINSQCKRKVKIKMNDSDEASQDDLDEKPLKKARFAWQVKRSGKSCELNDNMKEQGVKSDNDNKEDFSRKISDKCKTVDMESSSISDNNGAKFQDRLASHKQSLDADVKFDRLVHSTSKSSCPHQGGFKEERPETSTINSKPNTQEAVCKKDLQTDVCRRDHHQQNTASKMEPRKSTKTVKVNRQTYKKMWSRQHMAKAIADNAINMTLEEMGLSPDPNSNRKAEQTRLANQLESEGVSAAIMSRGLRRQSSEPVHGSPDRMRRFIPVVDRLSKVPETVFAQSMFANDLAMSSPSSIINQSHPIAASNMQVLSNTGSLRSERSPLQQRNPELTDTESILHSFSKKETNIKYKEYELDNVNECMELSNSTTQKESIETDARCQESDVNSSKDLYTDGDIDKSNETAKENFKLDDLNMFTPSTTDLLDHALNAAISEKGLFL